MFDKEFIEKLAKTLAKEIADQGRIVPRLLTLEQAASYMGMTIDALRYKATMGLLPAVRIDKRWRFDKEDLDKLIIDNKRIR